MTLPISGDKTSVLNDEKGVYHFNDFLEVFEGFVIGMIIADILACTNAIAKILQHDQIQAPNNGRNITMKNFHDKLEAYNTTSTSLLMVTYIKHLCRLHQTFDAATNMLFSRQVGMIYY